MRIRVDRPVRSIVAVAAGLVLTIAACSGDDDDAPDPSAVPTEAPGGESEPTAAPTGTTVPPADTTAAANDEGAAPPADDTAPTDDDTITIADFAFGGVTEVPVGTTVVVSNDDGTTHTWTATDGSFDSGALGQGDSFEFTFEEPGEFEYFCNFHPSMTGTITVTG